MIMTEDAGCLDNGPVLEPAMPEDEMLAMEEGSPAEPTTPEDEMSAMEEEMMMEPAMSEEEMLAMEEGMLNKDAPAAVSADDIPSPEEMLAMEEAMAEAEMNVEAEDVAPPSAGDTMGSMPSGLVCPLPVGVVDTSALEAHPLADLLPRMSESEFLDLKKSIEVDGLQNAVILFQGKILDGRNRYDVCKLLGVPIAVFEYVGTEQQALTYVLSSNQHRRKLSASQRGVVANETQPMVSEDVNAKRIEKIRQTMLEKASGKTSSRLIRTTQEGPKPVVSSQAIVADMLGVSTGYVGHAKRIKEADPELYHEVWAGRVTIPEALRKLDGITDDPRTVRSKKATRGVAKLLRDPGKGAEFLDQLEALLAAFA